MPTDGLSMLDQGKVEKAIEHLENNPDNERVQRIMQKGAGNYRFALWLHYVDQKMLRRYGLSVHDLADFCSRDAFDAGTSPTEAVREALENDEIGAAMLDDLGE